MVRCRLSPLNRKATAKCSRACPGRRQGPGFCCSQNASLPAQAKPLCICFRINMISDTLKSNVCMTRRAEGTASRRQTSTAKPPLPFGRGGFAAQAETIWTLFQQIGQDPGCIGLRVRSRSPCPGGDTWFFSQPGRCFHSRCSGTDVRRGACGAPGRNRASRPPGSPPRS